MKNTKTMRMTSYELGYKSMQSTIDFFLAIDIPPAEILMVLTDFTKLIGFGMGGRAGVDAAIQRMLSGIDIVEEAQRQVEAERPK